MVKNMVPYKKNRSKLQADSSRRDFINSGGYVGIVAHQSALRKGEQIMIPQYDKRVAASSVAWGWPVWNLECRIALPAGPPPNKFEGATLYYSKNLSY